MDNLDDRRSDSLLFRQRMRGITSFPLANPTCFELFVHHVKRFAGGADGVDWLANVSTLVRTICTTWTTETRRVNCTDHKYEKEGIDAYHGLRNVSIDHHGLRNFIRKIGSNNSLLSLQEY